MLENGPATDFAKAIWAHMPADSWRCAEATIADHRSQLMGRESIDLHLAIERRQFEFSTGRALAHELLHELGSATFEVEKQADRAPRWPENFFGTVTHTGERCVVGVVHARAGYSIGFDLERARELEAGVAGHVASREELAQATKALATLGVNQALAAVCVFSAKEAFYKAQHPLTQTFLGFFDVEARAAVDAAHAAVSFSITVLHDRVQARQERVNTKILPASMTVHSTLCHYSDGQLIFSACKIPCDIQ